jgi:hypothetical protein
MSFLIDATTITKTESPSAVDYHQHAVLPYALEPVLDCVKIQLPPRTANYPCSKRTPVAIAMPRTGGFPAASPTSRAFYRPVV